MESEVLAERILLDLQNIFKKDPLIDEFDILPVNDSVCNKCPVVHVEHKIALESWCIRHLYRYAYSKFMSWRQHPSKIGSSTLLTWTCAILLLNPDLETAWNARKELIESGGYLAKDDLKFSEIVLSRKPKSPQVFSHRKWVLTQLFETSISSCTANQIIQHELVLCTSTANKYSNNYYLWNHRMWIVQHLLHFCSNIITEELCNMEKWTSTHVSDHSGFHYRQFLIRHHFLFPQQKFFTTSTTSTAMLCPLHNSNEFNCDRKSNNGTHIEFFNLLTKEMLFLSDLQMVYPGHETLWNHRRFIIHEMVHYPECAKLFFSTSPNCYQSGSKKSKIECDFFAVSEWHFANEGEFLQQCAANRTDDPWEQKLISRHIEWLKNAASCPVSLPCI